MYNTTSPQRVSRRGFLGCARMLVPVGVGYQGTSSRIAPVRSEVPRTSPAHLHASGEDPLAKALAARVGNLKGFDPMRTLSAFDWGESSLTPAGQTVRTYRVAARDMELE